MPTHDDRPQVKNVRGKKMYGANGATFSMWLTKVLKK